MLLLLKTLDLNGKEYKLFDCTKATIYNFNTYKQKGGVFKNEEARTRTHIRSDADSCMQEGSAASADYTAC
jgi:hypothetical protein